MSVKWITADVFDGLAQLEDESVDLVVTSPPFLALRSYLPADHPDKAKEIGQEANPAAFIDTLLAVTAELRRVLAAHGSICVELGDTYAGGGQGPDAQYTAKADQVLYNPAKRALHGEAKGWPLAKSKALIPELYRVALAYGINPLTGAESPAGRWRIRNVVTWCRPNPPVGALGDKWRPATSDIVIACVSDRRYWDDIATRRPHQSGDHHIKYPPTNYGQIKGRIGETREKMSSGINPAGAPLLDWWELPPGGYPGSHYAVYPPELVVPLVQAMLPPKVCRTCGQPSRRIVKRTPEYEAARAAIGDFKAKHSLATGLNGTTQHHAGKHIDRAELVATGWTDCGHDDYRPPVILDPFAGSGTTLAVALGHNPDATAIGIDLDERNEELARDRVGPLLWVTEGSK